MNRDANTTIIEQALREVPLGKIKLNYCYPVGLKPDILINNMDVQFTGKVRMDVYTIYQGVQVVFGWYQTPTIDFHHDSQRSIIEITYCKAGRVGWNMKNDVSVYFGPGDLTLQPTTCCYDSCMNFPLGYFSGIHIIVDLEKFLENSTEILQDMQLNSEELHQNLFPTEEPLTIRSSEYIEQLFDILFNIPQQKLVFYLKLKLQELILFLDAYKQPTTKTTMLYPSEQIKLIKEVQEYLTNDVSKRHTIEALSKKYLINTSSLKNIFKAVYGLPIASYMREYRIKQAMRMLRETDESIAQIALAVGYENQSKFTSAFKDYSSVLPKEYRKEKRA